MQKKEKALLLEIREHLNQAGKKLQVALKLMGKTPKALHYIGVAADIERNMKSIYVTENSSLYKGDVVVEPKLVHKDKALTARALYKQYKLELPYSESLLHFSKWLLEHGALVKTNDEAQEPFKKVLEAKEKRRFKKYGIQPAATTVE